MSAGIACPGCGARAFLGCMGSDVTEIHHEADGCRVMLRLRWDCPSCGAEGLADVCAVVETAKPTRMLVHL